VHFDGAKDFFKYLLDLKKYEPRRSRADIQAMGVTDYYGTARIAAQTAAT
jgi:copper chaperone NosL